MISGKDITIDKEGSIILNGDKYPLALQAEIDAVKNDIDNLGDTIGDITQTGLTGDSVAAQLGTAREQISRLTTPTLIWEGDANAINTNYIMNRNYTDFKYLLVSALTNTEVKNMLILTSSIQASRIYDDAIFSGKWDTTDKAFTYNSCYGIQFTAANTFWVRFLAYNNSSWILRPIAIYGIG